MPPPHPSRALVLSAFAAVYLIWGSTYLAIRFAIETLPPFLMAGTRFALAGAALLAWCRVRGEAWPSGREWVDATAIGALLLLGGNGAVVWAEQWVPSGVTALLIATVPLWIAILQGAAGRTLPSGAEVLGLLLGFGGVALLVEPWKTGGERVHLPGALALVGGSLSWAVGSLWSRRARLPRSPVLATAMQMLAGGLCLGVAGLLRGEAGVIEPDAVSTRSVAALVYLFLFGSLVAFTAYVWLLQVVRPSLVATYAFVNPVVAVVLGWALGGEALGARTLLAAAVIVGAVALITLARAPSGGEGRRR